MGQAEMQGCVWVGLARDTEAFLGQRASPKGEDAAYWAE